MNKKDNSEGSELTDQKKGREGRKEDGDKERGRRVSGGKADYTLLPFPRDGSVHGLVLTHGTWKSLNADIHTYDCVNIRVYLLLCVYHTLKKKKNSRTLKSHRQLSYISWFHSCSFTF